MSGGEFDYTQYQMGNTARQIEEMLGKRDDEFYGHIRDDTRLKFQEAILMLKKAEIAVQRIDWFVSGDDGEDTFHERWGKDYQELMAKEIF